MTLWRLGAGGERGWLSCLLLIVLLTISAFALRSYNYINGDVSWLVWTANEVLGPPVFGTDILDVCPPLCFAIYMPAVLLAPTVGFEWGIRLWMLFLSALSVTALWHSADRTLRLPLVTVFVLFIILASPNNFAQREQIALLLCAPYVAGPSSNRYWAVVIGLMAGIGFAIKPHFLIPLALLWAVRRRIGIEELGIIAAGCAYAVILWVFFRAYIFEMVPMAAATYWGITRGWLESFSHGMLILLSVLPVVAAAGPLPAARPYLIATAGFALAALLQNKGFHYHFIPAFGFLVMFLTASAFGKRRFAVRVAVLFLLMQVVFLGNLAITWLGHYAQLVPFSEKIKAELDKSGSFISFYADTYPAFPTVLYTSSRYAGTAIYQIFVPAVARHELGLVGGDPQQANRLALDQAIRELRRKPDLVIAGPSKIDDEVFDNLEWYKKDEDFRELWKDYYPAKQIERFTFYRRK